MEKVYSALYLAIFLQFLRRLHRKMSPQEGELKYGLYLNLADLQMSIRLATAGYPAELSTAYEAMRKELWNSASLEITNTSPKYPAFELHSKEVAEILPIILIGRLDAIVTGRALGNKNVTRL